MPSAGPGGLKGGHGEPQNKVHDFSFTHVFLFIHMYGISPIYKLVF